MKYKQFLGKVKTSITLSMTIGLLASSGIAQAAIPYLASNVIGQTSYTTDNLNGVQAPNDAGFDSPQGIALDGTAHILFIADTNNHRVLGYNLSSTNTITDRHADIVLGQANFNTHASGATSTTLNKPTGMFADTTNKLLYIVDSLNNRVMIFDYTTPTNGMSAVKVLGQSNFTTVTAATTQSGLKTPNELTLDTSNSMLYVTDSGNYRLMVFDVSAITNGQNAVKVLGKTTFTDGSAGALTASSFSTYSGGVAIDQTGQRLFVSDGTYRRVLVYDVATITNGEAAVNVLGAPDFTTFGGSSADATTVRYRSGLVYAPDTNYLYVSEQDGGMTKVFDVATVTNGESAINVLGRANFSSMAFQLVNQSRTASPMAAAYDSVNKKLFSVDRDYHRVVVFDIATIVDGEAAVDGLGQVLSTGAMRYDDYWPNSQTANANGLFTSWGVAVDKAHHRLFVSEESNSRVGVYNLDSTNQLIDTAADTEIGQLNLDSARFGTTQNTLNAPRGIAYDEARQWLYVADNGNNRILIFDVSSVGPDMSANYVIGQPNFTSSTSNLTSTNLDYVTDLAYDANHKNLFAVDYFNNRVLVYDVTSPANGMAASKVIGQTDFISDIDGTTSTQFGSCCNLAGIAYDESSNLLFVSDQINSRIMIFDGNNLSNGMAASHVLGQPDFTTVNSTASASILYGPGALALDTDEHRLYVLDLNYRMVGFDTTTITDGEPAVAVLGQPDYDSGSYVGISRSSVDDVGGLAFDPLSGNLYISETYFERVTVFGLIRITTTSMPVMTVDAAYNTTLITANSQGTVSFNLSSGTLPPGITLSSGGVLTGTPTTAGNYSFKIKATDNNGAIGTFTDSKTYNITVAPKPVDSDGDGTPDSVEASGPNNGDANGNGILDATEPNVASTTNAMTNAYSVIQANAGTVSNYSVLRESDLANKNSTVDFPVGLNSFHINGLANGGQSPVKVYYDKVYDTSAWTYMKYNTVNGTYKDMSSIVTYGTAVVGSKTVTTASYTLTDGGAYDEDGLANGVIIDPSGPAVLGATTPNTGFEMTRSSMPALSLTAGIVLLAYGLYIQKRKA